MIVVVKSFILSLRKGVWTVMLYLFGGKSMCDSFDVNAIIKVDQFNPFRY